MLSPDFVVVRMQWTDCLRCNQEEVQGVAELELKVVASALKVGNPEVFESEI